MIYDKDSEPNAAYIEKRTAERMTNQPPAQRYDLNGNPLPRPHILTTRCEECHMPLTAYAEFHPYEACVEFKRTHDSRTVLAMLEAQRG